MAFGRSRYEDVDEANLSEDRVGLDGGQEALLPIAVDVQVAERHLEV
jgi:hypothetical protein